MRGRIAKRVKPGVVLVPVMRPSLSPRFAYLQPLINKRLVQRSSTCPCSVRGATEITDLHEIRSYGAVHKESAISRWRHSPRHKGSMIIALVVVGRRDVNVTRKITTISNFSGETCARRGGSRGGGGMGGS